MTLRLKAGVSTARVDGETVLLDPVSGAYYGLDPIGSRMLDLMLTGNGPVDVGAVLSREYAAAADDIARDAEALAASLVKAGLAETSA